jgi:hypothetical protein
MRKWMRLESHIAPHSQLTAPREQEIWIRIESRTYSRETGQHTKLDRITHQQRAETQVQVRMSAPPAAAREKLRAKDPVAIVLVRVAAHGTRHVKEEERMSCQIPAPSAAPRPKTVSVVVSDLPTYVARGLRLGWMERSRRGERGLVAG